MGRPPIGKRALTDAEKQKNYRERLKARQRRTDSEIVKENERLKAENAELRRQQEASAAKPKPQAEAKPSAKGDAARIRELEHELQAAKMQLEREAARRDVVAKAEPEIERFALSMTAQEKLKAAIRQANRKLDAEFETRVLAECKRRLDEISLPHYAKEIAELERSISSRKGIMDRVAYRKILSCLHPDRVPDPVLKKRYEEAFRLFTELEKRVLDEKQSPTEFRKMPRTYEELMAMKAKVQAENRAKRAAARNAKSDAPIRKT